MKSREQRQFEAVERKWLRAQRTPGEQLVILRERGITSGAEWDRLTAIIESGASHLSADALDKPVYEDISTHPKPKLKAKERRARERRGE